MNKQIKLILGLSLLASIQLNADNIKGGKISFTQKMLIISEKRKFGKNEDKALWNSIYNKVKKAIEKELNGKKLVEQLSLKEKEFIVYGLVEDILDEKHYDTMAVHAKLINFLFTDKALTNKNEKDKIEKYKEMARILEENKKTNVDKFLFCTIPDLQAKAPQDVVAKIQALSDKLGYLKVRSILSAKLK